MAREIWGVDSAAKVTESLYQCVVENYGAPKYWGRYLSTVPNVSDGLTDKEIRFLRQKGIKILPIYNENKEAVGYDKGKVAARNATFHARRMKVPKGTFLFANTEKFFTIDEGWIRGWVDALYTSLYRPGIYADPSTDTFNNAYCTASEKNEKVPDQLVIWSQEPTPGATSKGNAPSYNPRVPPCKANVWAWQYGENAAKCPIDTNLLDRRLFEHLW
ncbi:glycoside hydrolase domain-containing protein [Bacillus sp. FJAT-47783]|uniref:glycoside hydrolase domain-containing protein n=1 Tax=Bacillus sp. FJAT-47783 TaxID=2922712 RepID=UPI001FAC1308|nr:glycoside hydrolase domain-containing protein [Bacillus sp. FJAT-47783]